MMIFQLYKCPYYKKYLQEISYRYVNNFARKTLYNPTVRHLKEVKKIFFLLPLVSKSVLV